MHKRKKRFCIALFRLLSVAVFLALALASITGYVLADVGDIAGVIDTLEFDATWGMVPDIIHVAGNVYAIAYTGYDYDGFLRTVEIATDGQITDTIIDTLEFDTKKGKTPNIIHISGDIYAVAYEGDKEDGFLKTVEIATSGQITNTVIDTLEFDTSNGETPSIVNISGNVYAIAYEGSDSDGFLKTVEIATNGEITDTVIDTLEFDTSNGETPSIVNVLDNVYAIAYEGSDSDGYLKTVEIATNGEITDTVIDTLEFDTSEGMVPDLIHVSGDVYAIAYDCDYYEGFLKTVGIDSQAIMLPTVTTDNATLVEEESATLNGVITDDGGEACQYQFEYDIDSGAPYTHNTGWTGNLTTGQYFSASITGLDKGTKYYFRAQARNSSGTIDGSELSFLTKPDPPVTFSASAASDTQIDLAWTKGEGAQRTMVRRKTGDYPVDRDDGHLVYFDTGTSVSDTGLTPDTTYYYKSWSEVTGSQQWSDGFAAAITTTGGGAAPPTAVGGVIYPVNRMLVLSQWTGLILISLLAAGIFVMLARRVGT